MQAPHARGNLSILLNAICVACKFVDSAVRKVSHAAYELSVIDTGS